jgi:hypothetical protein
MGVPQRNAGWLARVEAYQRRYDVEYAEGHVMSVKDYLVDATHHVQRLTDGEVRIRLHEDQLQEFLEQERWKTLFTGGRSRGIKCRDTRVDIEELVLGVLRTCPDEARPAYGYLHGSDETHNSVNGWGEVVIHLRDRVRTYATVTFGDSLDSTRAADTPTFAAARLDQPDAYCRFPHRDVCTAKKLHDAVDPDCRYAEIQLYEPLQIGDILYVSFTDGLVPSPETTRLLNTYGITLDLVQQVS